VESDTVTASNVAHKPIGLVRRLRFTGFSLGGALPTR
jgi:hypothetical protein